MFGDGLQEQIDKEIICQRERSRGLHAEHKERVANLIASGDYHVVPMGGPPNLRCKIIWRDDGTVKTPVDGFQYIVESGQVYLPDDVA